MREQKVSPRLEPGDVVLLAPGVSPGFDAMLSTVFEHRGKDGLLNKRLSSLALRVSSAAEPSESSKPERKQCRAEVNKSNLDG
jgi:hypothetical protein